MNKMFTSVNLKPSNKDFFPLHNFPVFLAVLFLRQTRILRCNNASSHVFVFSCPNMVKSYGFLVK